MDFLQLVQRTRRECGVAGSGPSTTASQTGELAKLVEWVQQSWVEIQEEQPDWGFLRNPVSFLTQYGTTQVEGDTVKAGQVYELVSVGTTNFDVIGELYSGQANTAGSKYQVTTATVLGAGDSTKLVGKNTYTVGPGTTYDINLSDFSQWAQDSFRAYLVASGVASELYLTHVADYSAFIRSYAVGASRLVVARPTAITADPRTRSLLLGYTPNDVYRATGEYYRSPQVLTADSDEPIIPAHYHMAIVYKAMTKYGLYQAATEQIEAGNQGFLPLINLMRQEYLPQVTL